MEANMITVKQLSEVLSSPAKDSNTFIPSDMFFPKYTYALVEPRFLGSYTANGNVSVVSAMIVIYCTMSLYYAEETMGQ
jgi:hypothetical protein